MRSEGNELDVKLHAYRNYPSLGDFLICVIAFIPSARLLCAECMEFRIAFVLRRVNNLLVRM